MTIASVEQTPHLPPAQPGYGYRLRSIDGEQYVTTGTFANDAPDDKLANLARAGTLILDCDLADFVVASEGLTGKDLKVRTDEIKRWLTRLPQSDLDPLLSSHLAQAYAWTSYVAGAEPTVVVGSGHGWHVYLWLYDSQGFKPEIPDVRKANANLIQAINNAAGYPLADPRSKDPGTHLLRIPGTINRKGIPRRVTIQCADYNRRFDYRRYLSMHTMHATQPVCVPSTPTHTHGDNGAAGTQEGTGNGAPRGSNRGNDGTSTNAQSLADFSQLFAKSDDEARKAIHLIMTTCPFFLWAQENPTHVGKESWRGAATNIAALSGELGREAFHDFSKLDKARYNRYECDRFYTAALESARSHGPMTYATLRSNGDWQGNGPEGAKAPASLRFVSKAITLPASAQVAIDHKTGKPYATPGNLRKILRADDKYGARLTHNVLTGNIEIDGIACDDSVFGDAQEYLEDNYKVPFRRDHIQFAVREVAMENTHDPIRTYLDALNWDGIDRVSQIATEVLGIEPRPLFLEYLRCFLVGAVRRAFTDDAEGVKLETALILKGAQGIRKSTFFRVLGGKYFCDSAMDITGKDAYLILRSSWIIEWGEFENTLSRTSIARVKAFLSSNVDTYRPPYARETITVPRRCIIVGTTNEDHFLHDTTGSRRFWVIECPHDIDTVKLQSMRDQLWAQAVVMHKQGVPHWLTSQADSERASMAEQYQQEEPWESIVTRHVEQRKITDVSIETLLVECIQKEAKDWRTGDAMMLGRILHKLGFERYRIRVGGKREYRYRKIGAAYPTELTNGAASSNVVAFSGVGHAIPR